MANYCNGCGQEIPEDVDHCINLSCKFRKEREPYKTYSRRIWLDENDLSATSSIVSFYGPRQGYGGVRTEPMFEIADCQWKIRLHQTTDMENYIKKIRIVAQEATKFTNFLEALKGGSDGN